jgi:hypothetical protein
MALPDEAQFSAGFSIGRQLGESSVLSYHLSAKNRPQDPREKIRGRGAAQVVGV